MTPVADSIAESLYRKRWEALARRIAEGFDHDCPVGLGTMRRQTCRGGIDVPVVQHREREGVAAGIENSKNLVVGHLRGSASPAHIPPLGLRPHQETKLVIALQELQRLLSGCPVLGEVPPGRRDAKRSREASAAPEQTSGARR
jgi:hypothetical protein